MASEIRVDKINSLSGVGTVTLSPTGVDIAGITTAATLRATTGIVTSLTAGSLTSLGAVSGTTGTFSGAVSGTTGTFSGDIKTTAATVNVKSGSSINTNSDSSAHGALHKNTNSGEFAIVSGGTGGNNHLTFYTSASAAPTEKVRILSDGKVGVNKTAPNFHLDVAGNIGLTEGQVITWHDGSGTKAGDMYIDSSDNFIIRNTSSVTERLRITSAGNIGINNNNPQNKLLVTDSGSVSLPVIQSHITGSNGGFLGYGLYSDVNSKFTFSVTNNGRVTANDGIIFGSDTAAANVLDDYEEGTWTPSNSTYGFESGSTTEGHYTKIGDLVYASGICKIANNGSGIALYIDGLPFTAKDGSSGSYIQGGFVTYANQGNNAFVLIANNGTRIYFYTLAGGDHIGTNWDNDHLRFTVIYKTA